MYLIERITCSVLHEIVVETEFIVLALSNYIWVAGSGFGFGNWDMGFGIENYDRMTRLRNCGLWVASCELRDAGKKGMSMGPGRKDIAQWKLETHDAPRTVVSARQNYKIDLQII